MDTLMENTSKQDQKIAKSFLANLLDISPLKITSLDVEIKLPGSEVR